MGGGALVKVSGDESPVFLRITVGSQRLTLDPDESGVRDARLCRLSGSNIALGTQLLKNVTI